jgi:multiple sugar transport system substrate-binding protein
MFYRTDILASAGFRDPPKTWSEWVRAGEAIRKLGHRYAILLPTNEWTQPIALGLQLDAPILRDDGRYGAFSEPRFKRAFDFYLDFYRRGDAPVVSSQQVGNMYQEFGEGQFAMYIGGPWHIEEFRRRLPVALKDQWMTAPLPAPDGKTYPGASLAGGGSLIIFKRSKQKEAAWKLISFLSQPAQQARFFELSGDLPARRSAWDSPAVKKDPYLAAFRAQLENVAPTPRVPQWEQIATSVFDFAEMAIRGHYTPDRALALLDQKTNGILEKRRWMLDREAR